MALHKSCLIDSYGFGQHASPRRGRVEKSCRPVMALHETCLIDSCGFAAAM